MSKGSKICVAGRQDRTVARKVARSGETGEFEQQLTNARRRTASARPTRRVAPMTTQPPNDRPRFSAGRPCAEQLLQQPVGISNGVAPPSRKTASRPYLGVDPTQKEPNGRSTDGRRTLDGGWGPRLVFTRRPPNGRSADGP